MKQLLSNWSWLLCLLVAIQVPVIFLSANIKAGPMQRMWSLVGKEPSVEAAGRLVWVSICVVLVALWIFAGWKAALLVLVGDMLALAADEIVAVPFHFLVKSTHHPAYSLMFAPAIWALAGLALLAVRLSR